MSNYPHWNPEKFVFTLVVTGFLALLWCCGMAAYHIEHPIYHKAANGINTKYVQKWFDSINQTQFDGSLPPTVVVFGPTDDGADVVGETYCTLSPVNAKPTSCKIYVVPKYNLAGPVAAETVIHEACHEATYDVDSDLEDAPHGPHWQACMLRIAENGGFRNVW